MKRKPPSRNHSRAKSIKITHDMLLDDRQFQALEAGFKIFISSERRKQIHAAIRTYFIQKNMKGISKREISEAVRNQLDHINGLLSLLHNADRGNNIDAEVIFRIGDLAEKYKLDPHLPPLRANLIVHKRLLETLLKNIKYEDSDKGGRGPDAAFLTFIREILEIHALIKSDNQRNRLNRTEFFKEICNGIKSPDRPKPHSAESLEKQIERVAKNLSRQNSARK